METPEPVVVFYKSKTCGHCVSLSSIWNDPPSHNEDSVVTAMRKAHPKIRFFIVTANDNSGKFDENSAPKDIIRYAKWFPMVLLVPGRLWDDAMSKIGTDKQGLLEEGVQIMNGTKSRGKIEYSQMYNMRKPSDFARWLKDSMQEEEFKKVQGSLPEKVIQPFLKTINDLQRQTRKEYMKKDEQTNTCTMRIISRPRNS